MSKKFEMNIQRNDSELSLKSFILKIQDWWCYLWEKKWIILISGVIGGGLGLVYSLRQKNSYTATTTFVLESGEKNGGGLAAYAGLASMIGMDLSSGGGGIFQGENILQLYKSRSMIEKTLFSISQEGSSKSLIEEYLEFNKTREAWEDKPELKELDFSIQNASQQLKKVDPRVQRLKDSIIGNIVESINKNNLSVQRLDKKLSIIKVDVISSSEHFSKRFNEELVTNVNDFYLQTKTKKSLDNISILQYKTDSVRAVMNGAIYNAVAIADATPNSNPTRQLQRVAPIQKAQFSAETNRSILGELVKNLEMSKMALMRESPLIQIVDGPKYPLHKEKFGKAKGVALGGFLFGFLTLFSLILKKIYKDIING